MIQCQNCGNINNYGSNFCRFCGTKIVADAQSSQPPFYHHQSPPQHQQQQQQHQSYENNPPRPYSWKTDEFQAAPDPRFKTRRTQQEINRVQPLSNLDQSQPLAAAYQQPYPAATAAAVTSYGYRCPRCGTQSLPILTRKISTAGWIVFVALLLFFFPLFWIGLLMKEDSKICPVCNLQIH